MPTDRLLAPANGAAEEAFELTSGFLAGPRGPGWLQVQGSRLGALPRWSSLLLLTLLLVSPVGVWAAMVAVGQPAPPVRVHDMEGRAVVLGEATPDQALLVMFSTIGCVPCRESKPLLAAAGEQYAGRLAAVCVMLAEPERVRAMLAVEGETPELTFYADTAGDGPFPIAGAYGVMGTPTTFLIGADGLILWRQVGRITAQNLTEDIPRALDRGRDGVGLLAEPSMPPPG